MRASRWWCSGGWRIGESVGRSKGNRPAAKLLAYVPLLSLGLVTPAAGQPHSSIPFVAVSVVRVPRAQQPDSGSSLTVIVRSAEMLKCRSNRSKSLDCVRSAGNRCARASCMDSRDRRRGEGQDHAFRPRQFGSRRTSSGLRRRSILHRVGQAVPADGRGLCRFGRHLRRRCQRASAAAPASRSDNVRGPTPSIALLPVKIDSLVVLLDGPPHHVDEQLVGSGQSGGGNDRRRGRHSRLTGNLEHRDDDALIVPMNRLQALGIVRDLHANGVAIGLACRIVQAGQSVAESRGQDGRVVESSRQRRPPSAPRRVARAPYVSRWKRSLGWRSVGVLRYDAQNGEYSGGVTPLSRR